MEENVLKRIMPHSRDAEMSVIGAMLMDREAVAVASGMLVPEDFYFSQYGLFYECIIKLYNQAKPVDLVTVQEELVKRDAPPEVTDINFVKEIFNILPTGANIKAYCEIVRNKSLLRKFIRTAQEIENSCYSENKSVEEIAENVEKDIFEVLLKTSDKDPKTSKEVAESALSEIEEAARMEGNITGLATGYKYLDDLTGGLQKGDLIICAARPSMGKTAFVLNILEHVALKGNHPSILFSLEMNANLIMNRFFAMDTRINATKLRTGKLNDNEWESLVDSVMGISRGNLLIDDTRALTVNDIRTKCRKEKLKGGLDLIVVDYLQLMSAGKKNNENRQQEITEISRGLKALAGEMNCPVIALSQLSRAPETRADHRPMMADIRESGSIEQDADVIMFLYRDDYYTKEESERPGETDVIVAKQRNGGLDDITLMFNAETLRFYSKESVYSK